MIRNVLFNVVWKHRLHQLKQVSGSKNLQLLLSASVQGASGSIAMEERPLLV